VNHFTTPDFWQEYHALPRETQELADKNYRLLLVNPSHPSLHFKHIGDGLWSARVGIHYRALAFREEDGFYWFWIGSHADYDKLIG
jgi:hypothetical protein